MEGMLNAKTLALATSTLASALPACSHSELQPINFTPTALTRDSPDLKAALETAKVTCQKEARQKGIANMTAILLRGCKTSEREYIECMRREGFEAAQ